jgi:hypothetical protein
VINQDRATASRLGAADVAPAITNDKASAQIDSHQFRRMKKHARLGLSAKATLSVFLPGMETSFKPIKHWNGSSNGPIDLINRCASL